MRRDAIHYTVEEYTAFHTSRILHTLSVSEHVLRDSKTCAIIGVSPFDDLIRKTYPGVDFVNVIPSPSFGGLAANDGTLPVRPLIIDVTQPVGPGRPQFDSILFLEVLEHLLAPDREVIGNLRQLLVPGGPLILSVPNAATLRHRIDLLLGRNVHWPKEDIVRAPFGGLGHIREYTFAEVKNLLADGFDLILLKGLNDYRHGLTRVVNILPRTFANIILAIGQAK